MRLENNSYWPTGKLLGFYKKLTHLIRNICKITHHLMDITRNSNPITTALASWYLRARVGWLQVITDSHIEINNFSCAAHKVEITDTIVSYLAIHVWLWDSLTEAR